MYVLTAILPYSLTVVLLLHAVPLFAQQCNVNKESQYGFALLSSAYKTIKEQSLGSCFTKCLEDQKCSSINYKVDDGRCEHCGVTRSAFPSRYVQQDGTVYAEIRDTAEYGSSQHLALSSCKRIHELNTKASSGVYWIQIDSQSSAFQVYCDMETDGGGWTLVYSYRFMDFINFSSRSTNAVNPIPNWTRYLTKNFTSLASVSSAVPLSENSYAAMNFSLWKNIGNEFLSKTNILHWFSCKPVDGDLVNMKFGSISCKIVKNVATACLNSVPNEFKMDQCGPALYKSNPYLIFAGSVRCWPVHDPCGTFAENHVKKVSNPSGALYVR